MGKFTDLTGQRFGSLMVLRRHTENTKEGKPQWVCICDCGKETITSGHNLKCGNTKSCGCLKINASRIRAIDITGMRFGRLLVQAKTDGNKWRCVCECGNTIITAKANLLSGDTRSCGCLQREIVRGKAQTHGMTGTRLYNIWRGMHDRCRRKRNHAYKNYGGRGISVCDEWADFSVFRDWALTSGYRDNLTIDRIDTDGDYCPANCRWSTYKEQANNKRNNHLLTDGNETKTLTQWADSTGIKRGTLSTRVLHGKKKTQLKEP